MAYEDMTYEVLMSRMMTRVQTNYPNLDDREGSIIFNALAPAAMELAIAYYELDNILKESFVDTASREYILLKCKEQGIDTDQFDASAGTFRGEFNVQVSIGSRWNLDMFNYTVTEFIAIDSTTQYYKYKLVCESTGTAPNNQTGTLTPITEEPSGLTHAELTACLIEGENEKSDDEIRNTYYDYLNSNAEDGNVSQYKRWCDAYDGVGNYKIVPLWNGANTVKVSILNASNRAASSALVAEVQNYFDPLVNGSPSGMGNGVAPIGAFVTVGTATELAINVSANITMKSGYTDTTPINTALTKYFAEIAYDKTMVAYMNVGAIILSVEGVESISNLTINSGTSDISLTTYQIPVLGTTNWTVV